MSTQLVAWKHRKQPAPSRPARRWCAPLITDADLVSEELEVASDLDRVLLGDESRSEAGVYAMPPKPTLVAT